MLCFQRQRRAALLFFVLVVVAGVACQSRTTDQGKELPPDVWSVEQPVAVKDDSLSIAEYSAIGIPSVERTWGTDELAETVKQLQQLIARTPGALPRYRSVKSELLFGRLTSPANLTRLRDASLPVSIRLPASIEFMRETDALYGLYLEEFQLHHVSDTEVVELQGARLRTIEVVFDALESSMHEHRTEESVHAARRSAFDRIRDGLGEVLLGMSRAAEDPRRFGVTARKRLVGYCLQSYPKILPKLSVKGREVLIGVLDAQDRNPHLSNLQPQLGQLSRSAASAVLAP